MIFYHCFFTDLPDQFVEANVNALKRWTDGWTENPYLVQSRIIDSVSVDLIGKVKRDKWPTLKCASQPMLKLWMRNKGANYNGGYWGTLAEDQRDPNRVSCDPGRDDTEDAWAYGASSIWNSVWGSSPGRAARTGLTPVNVRQLWVGMDEATVKPPLKREGVVAGEIIGYRCWRVEKGHLRSVYQPDVWKAGEILEGRELGDWDQRGIHAWKDPASKHYHDYIRAYLNDQSDPMWRVFMFGNSPDRKDDPRPAMVTGTVFLWGDVVEHERGYRAEYARIRSLDWLYPDATMMGREQQALNELRERYGLLDPVSGVGDGK